MLTLKNLCLHATITETPISIITLTLDGSKMRISEIHKIYKMLEITPTDITTLLLGAPGIGKSEVIMEYARERAKKLGLRFVDLDEVHSLTPNELKEVFAFKDFRLTDAADVTDLIGFPRIIEKEKEPVVEYVPWRWIYHLANARAGLLFLDGITNVQRPDILAAAYKLINERKIGFTKLPKDVQIVAAGNSPEHSALAAALPTPLMSRMQVINVDPPTVEEWAAHMNKTYGPDGWDHRVAAYLGKAPAKFFAPPKSRTTLEAYPVPRAWTRLAIKLKNTPPELLRDVAISFVGSAAGGEFASLCEAQVDFDAIIANPQKFSGLDKDKKWLICSLITDKLTALPTDDELNKMLRQVKDDKQREELKQAKQTKQAIYKFLEYIGPRSDSHIVGIDFLLTIVTALPPDKKTELVTLIQNNPKIMRKMAKLYEDYQKYLF